MKLKIINNFFRFFSLGFIFFVLPVHADFKTTYNNVPLSNLITTISNVTNKSFTYSQQTATIPVSLVMSSELSKEEVYLLFLSSLKVSGLKAVEEFGGLVSIYPIGNVTGGIEEFSNFSFKTIVMTLKNVKADYVSKSLEPLISSGGYVSPAGDFKIILKDTPVQIDHIKRLVLSLDHKSIDPIISNTVTLNNLVPSSVKEVDGVKLLSFDSVNRLVIRGRKSLVDEFSDTVIGLDLSIKTVHVRMLISTVTTDFSDEYNISGLFEFGIASLTFSSFGLESSNSSDGGISALVSIFEQYNDVNILSRPFLQVREGKQASFNVGREVPILLSTVDSETGQTIRNVERKNVGLSISLLTEVRPDGLVSIDLNQNLSSISETQLDQVSDLITDDQTLNTSLLLKPDHIYAVGGLTDSRTFSSKTDVPFFSVFDSESLSRQGQEIIIFIEVSLTDFKSNDLGTYIGSEIDFSNSLRSLSLSNNETVKGFGYEEYGFFE